MGKLFGAFCLLFAFLLGFGILAETMWWIWGGGLLAFRILATSVVIDFFLIWTATHFLSKVKS